MTRTATNILDRARAYVAKMAAAVAGSGGHNHTFAVAMVLVHGFGLSYEDALRLLREYNLRCSPVWSERELVHKIESAIKTPSGRPHGYLLQSGDVLTVACVPRSAPRSAQPVIDPATAVENYLEGFRCEESDLWEASPIRPPQNWRDDGAALVANLYRPDERINIVTDYIEQEGKARPVGVGHTIERDEFFARRNPESKAGAWVRMNPADGAGIGDVNVTAFRFALLECDHVPPELQLALFAHLSIPVAALLTSGARSVHCWIKVDAPDAPTYRTIVGQTLELLARFGIDGKNKNPSRLSRLPGAQRVIGAKGDGRQRLLYLNPTPEQERIFA